MLAVAAEIVQLDICFFNIFDFFIILYIEKNINILFVEELPISQ